MGVTTRRFISRLLVAAVFGGLCAVPPAAAAQEDAQIKAREFYQQGKDLFEAGKLAESLKAFQEAYDTKPHPVVLKSIAECQFQLLDIKAAVATIEKYLADPGPTDKPEVEQRLATIRKSLATMEILSQPEGAGVMIDGSVTGEVTPVTIDLNPGDHEIVLNLEGYEPLLKSVALTGGEQGRLEVDFASEGTPVQPEDPLADPFGDDDGGAVKVGSEGPPTAFWVAAAVAGVGLISGTVFGTMALGDEDDYKKNPSDDIKKSGERNAIIADVSFGVAAAAAIVGAVILITNKGEAKAEVDTAKARFDVQPVATGEHIGVSTSLYF